MKQQAQAAGNPTKEKTKKQQHDAALVPVPTLEWHPPTAPCQQALETAVGMQGRGDIGFYEVCVFF